MAAAEDVVELTLDQENKCQINLHGKKIDLFQSYNM